MQVDNNFSYTNMTIAVVYFTRAKRVSKSIVHGLIDTMIASECVG